MSATLSVIIPIYKVEDYLERCVISVLNQDYKDFEVILVDDGSPDRCPEICDELAKKDERVKVIHKPNGGLSSARNAGTKIASGKYILYLDSDDQWENCLQQIISYMELNPCDFLVFRSKSLYPDGAVMTNTNSGIYKRNSKYLNSKEYYDCAFQGGVFHEAAYTKLILTSFLKENALFFKEGIIGEDTEWMFRVLRAAKKIGVIDKTLYIYTASREGAITNSVSIKKIKDMISVFDDCIQYNKTHENPLKEEELSYCSFLWLTAVSKSSLLADKNEKKEADKLLKKYTYLLSTKYEMPQVKKIKTAYKLFGVSLTNKLLRQYMILRHNVLFRKLFMGWK